MNALVSGQAGIAVMIQGNEVSFMDLEARGSDRPSSPSAVCYLLAGATDVFEVKGTERKEVLARLEKAWRFDRALQLALISLDRSESLENRTLCIECLGEFFNDSEVCDYVGNRLYSAPLPTAGDIRTALSLARRHESVAQFLATLESDQPRIDRNRAAWDSLPLSIFESQSAKRDFFEAVVESGAFRVLARAGNDAPAFGLASIQCHTSLMAHPNYRKVLQAWLHPLRPSRGTPIISEPLKQQVEAAQSESDRHRDRTRQGGIHGLFENVKKQKQAIVERIRKGDIANVRTYATQLMDSQLKSSDPEFPAMSLCDLAQEAKNVHNHSLQLELAQKAVEVAPEDGWAHGQVADAYVCLGQYDDALRSFQLAAAFGKSAFAATGVARILHSRGKLDDALRAYDEAIVSFPEEVVPWNGRAEVLRDMWKLDEALRAYDSAIAKFPTEVVPRCGRAAVLTDMGRLKEALETYDQTIIEFGNDCFPVCGRADVLKEMGRLDQAFEAYTNAIRKFPTEPVPRCGKAEVLKEMGRLEGALGAYSETADMFPHEVVSLSGRAETFKRMGNYDQALASYEESLVRFPEDARARNGKADVLKRLGRLTESLRIYDENIKRSPYDIVAGSGRADLLKELGHFKEAIEAYDFVISRNPRKQSVRNAKAAILVILRRYEEALRLLPEGEPQTRDEWIAQHIRGMVFLKRGKHDLALRVFEKGLAKNPFAKERRYFETGLAVAKLRMNRFDQAIAHLGEDKEPLTNVLRIHAFGGLKQLDRARQAVESLERNCPPGLAPLRDELVARYKISSKPAKHDSRWVFDQECRYVLLEAA
jgi:tetratricopeptide (TPR) repeat protein